MEAMSVEEIAADCEMVRVSTNDRVSGVATVSIHRPETRNALNKQVRSELKRVLDAIRNSEVRVVVLTGSDEAGAFVAGADVAELRDRNGLEQRKVSARPRVYEYVDELPQPVIARINGHALGGGCELALGCDVRIAHVDAKLGQPEISLGIMPGGGATQRLPRLIGEGQAMRLCLSGEIIDATEAHEIGLVDEVHDHGFDERVYDLAGMMAEKSSLSLTLTKRAIRQSSRMDLDAGIEYEAELFAHLFNTDEKKERMDAFLDG